MRERGRKREREREFDLTTKIFQYEVQLSIRLKGIVQVDYKRMLQENKTVTIIGMTLLGKRASWLHKNGII